MTISIAHWLDGQRSDGASDHQVSAESMVTPAPRVGDAALVTEAVCLSGRGLTLTSVLNTLDILRRRLAATTRGLEGAFAGFDVFDISAWRSCEDKAAIVFYSSARLE